MFKNMCIAREFPVWRGGKSSPIVDWLRALAKEGAWRMRRQGRGRGRMCFTGGYALAMMTEPSVVAPVLSQPSMPIAMLKKNRGAIDVSDEEIACAKRRFEGEDLSMIGLRFKSDSMVPDERFATYKRHFGDRFEAHEFDDDDASPGHGPPFGADPQSAGPRRHADEEGRRAGDPVLPGAYRRPRSRPRLKRTGERTGLALAAAQLRQQRAVLFARRGDEVQAIGVARGVKRLEVGRGKAEFHGAGRLFRRRGMERQRGVAGRKLAPFRRLEPEWQAQPVAVEGDGLVHVGDELDRIVEFGGHGVLSGRGRDHNRSLSPPPARA